MSIKNWPKNERPREKLLSENAAVLSDADLLAILLRSGMKGKTAKDLALELLSHFGSLRNLLEASLSEFCEIKGLGRAKYAEMQAILEVNRRYLFENIQKKDVLAHSAETKKYLLAKMGQYQREIFACLFLDNKHRVIAFRELFQGSIDSATVYPREVVQSALVHHAAGVILVHNHPSGDPRPSDADYHLTKKLQEALSLVDIRVLDHVVVGKMGAISLMNGRAR